MRRILPQLLQRWQVIALVRARDPQLAAMGVRQIKGDLDQPATLRRLAGVANAVIHSAPPPATGETDTRTAHLLSALHQAKSLPRRIVYISTSGVYGDSQGAVVSETSALPAQTKKSARAIRRIDAERRLRAFARRANPGCCVSILRAPGIYAADRLPLERLRQGLPLFVPQQDNYTNHIHAADLGRACLAALHRGRPSRTYNISDDTRLLMGEWFDLLADSFALPRAPRLPREAVQQSVSPLQWSFMSESRQLDNKRMKHELGLRLRYPTVMRCLEENTCSG
ncbi:MAG: NAD(P)H-binding protein [Rugosibacter sp.]|nr:NAD(P)H-binding protein [Rugosibacter sp.]